MWRETLSDGVVVILANVEPRLTNWEAFARSLTPGAKMTKLALRDDAKEILLATAQNMQVGQSLAQQTKYDFRRAV